MADDEQTSTALLSNSLILNSRISNSLISNSLISNSRILESSASASHIGSTSTKGRQWRKRVPQACIRTCVRARVQAICGGWAKAPLQRPNGWATGVNQGVPGMSTRAMSMPLGDGRRTLPPGESDLESLFRKSISEIYFGNLFRESISGESNLESRQAIGVGIEAPMVEECATGMRTDTCTDMCTFQSVGDGPSHHCTVDKVGPACLRMH